MTNKTLLIVTASTLIALTATVACAEHYGAPLTLKNPIPLSTAIKQLDSKSSAQVLVESKVDKVCVVKGCWLGLVSEAEDIRVTFKDYAFFVPPSLIGKTVMVQG
ncbi:MAG: DUF4920 domain-containing protein, partial [Candidatus Obscuribacterales bacterium]|nr:DUF4920 domain-containing protein [Steroidobacteraceae bacterium]